MEFASAFIENGKHDENEISEQLELEPNISS